MSSSGLISNSQINSKNNLFNRQFQQEISYNVEETDAVIGYFLKRGFDEVAAVNIALVILKQAEEDNIPAFTLLDTFKGINDLTLNKIITQILNLNRSRATSIGYKITSNIDSYEQRNIMI